MTKNQTRRIKPDNYVSNAEWRKQRTQKKRVQTIREQKRCEAASGPVLVRKVGDPAPSREELDRNKPEYIQNKTLVRRGRKSPGKRRKGINS